MPAIKTEGAHEQNDTVIIEKMDGGVYIDDEAYLEGGYLHLPQAAWSFQPPTGRKVPVYQHNVHGQRPTQAGLVYYVDEETPNPLHDRWFINGVLPATYMKGAQGQLRYDREDRRQRRNINTVFGVIAGIIILATVLVNSQACGPDVHIIQEQPTQQTQAVK